MEYGYKLRNGAGLYRLPGVDGLFTKRGKVWNSFAALKSHLRMTAEHREYLNQCALRQVFLKGGPVPQPYPEVIPADWEIVRIGDGLETTLAAQAVLDGAQFPAEAAETIARLSFSFRSAGAAVTFVNKLTQLAEGYGLAWEFADDDRLTGRFWQDGGADDNNPQ